MGKKNNIFKYILLAIGVMLVSFCILFFYYGGMESMEIEIKEQGGEQIVFIDAGHDYSQNIWKMDSFWLELRQKEGLSSNKGVILYYPSNASETKTEIGCLVEDIDTARVKDLSAKYKVMIVPKSNYLTVEFKSKDRLSIFMGKMTIQRKMEEYIKKNKLDSNGWQMEVYDKRKDIVVYRRKI